MNIKQMEVFRALMRTGSVTRAAELLNVTPPGVSRMIKHLQMRLGVKLFERQGNRLVPLTDARLLHQEVERVYVGIDRVRTVAQELKLGVGQRLKLICSPSVAIRVGPRAVAALLRKYPSLSVEMEVKPISDIYQSLVAQQCDVAISLVPISHPNLQSKLLAEVGLVAAIPQAHPLAKRKKISIKALAQIPLVSFPANTTQGATVERLIAESGVILQSRVTVKTARDACALAREGVGAVVIDALTARDIDSTGLVLRPLDVRESYKISAMWSKDRPLGKIAAEFIESVTAGISNSDSFASHIR